LTIFVEPIALYMIKDLHQSKDGKWNFQYPDVDEEIPMGKFKEHGKGNALNIITYGNGLYLSLQARPEIEKKLKKKIKVIDLRWLSDIDIPNPGLDLLHHSSVVTGLSSTELTPRSRDTGMNPSFPFFKYL